MPKHSTRKAKGSKETARKPGLRDLEARKTNAAKGGFGNTSRLIRTGTTGSVRAESSCQTQV
jgi:hypothetical protein